MYTMYVGGQQSNLRSQGTYKASLRQDSLLLSTEEVSLRFGICNNVTYTNTRIISLLCIVCSLQCFFTISLEGHSGEIRRRGRRYGDCHQRKMTSREFRYYTLVTADIHLRCPALHCASLEKPYSKLARDR